MHTKYQFTFPLKTFFGVNPPKTGTIYYVYYDVLPTEVSKRYKDPASDSRFCLYCIIFLYNNPVNCAVSNFI